MEQSVRLFSAVLLSVAFATMGHADGAFSNWVQAELRRAALADGIGAKVFYQTMQGLEPDLMPDPMRGWACLPDPHLQFLNLTKPQPVGDLRRGAQ